MNDIVLMTILDSRNHLFEDQGGSAFIKMMFLDDLVK